MHCRARLLEPRLQKDAADL